MNLQIISYLCRMLLSIIIPVFRVEHTLQRCVESVLNQDVDDMEVILVDDGSPDNCPMLCDEWAEKDSRVKVIHKDNGGLSDARNVGINIATGDYITFVDSDDYLAPDTYAPLLEKIGDNDILEYSIDSRLTLDDNIYEDINEYWLKEKAYTHTYACNKIFKRSLFEEVRFPKGRVFEDVYTLPQLLAKTKKIATTRLGSYHYCWNPKGITCTADGYAIKQLLEAHLTGKMPIDDSYYMYLVNIQIDVWERLGGAIILPQRNIKTDALPFSKKLKSIVANIFGIRVLCRIIKVIHLIKKPSRL